MKIKGNQWKLLKTAISVFSLISFDFHWFWLFMLVFSKMEDIHSFKFFLVTKKSVLKRYFFAHFRVAHFVYWMPKRLLFTLYETTYGWGYKIRTKSVMWRFQRFSTVRSLEKSCKQIGSFDDLWEWLQSPALLLRVCAVWGSEGRPTRPVGFGLPPTGRNKCWNSPGQ